jgi:hypothetical protein
MALESDMTEVINKDDPFLARNSRRTRGLVG